MTAARLDVVYLNPDKYDYLHASLIQGLSRRSDVRLTTLNVGNYGGLAAVCSEGDLGAARRAAVDADAVIIGTSGRRGRLPIDLRTWTTDSALPGRPALVLVDSSDVGSIPLPRSAVKRFDLVFKRELYLSSRSWSRRIALLVGAPWSRSPEGVLLADDVVRHPPFTNHSLRHPAFLARPPATVIRTKTTPPVVGLSIGFEDRCVQHVDPDPQFEVTCTLTGNIPARRRLLDHLGSLEPGEVSCRVVADVADDDPDLVGLGAVSPARPNDHRHLQSYFRFLRSSRASISFPGGGFDTARFWEIAAAGSLVVSKTITLDLPDPPRPWEHYVPFDTFDELTAAIRFVHNSPDRADQIRRAGNEHVLRHHSPDGRARYVVEQIRELTLLGSGHEFDGNA